MTLSGRIGEINLASIFQNLAQNSSTGILSIRHGEKHWPVFLKSGRIAAIVPGQDWPDWLGGCLMRSTKIDEARWRKICEAWTSDQDLCELIKKRRAAPVKDVDDAIRFLQLESLYDLFQLETGEFVFEPGERKGFPAPFDRAELGMNPDSMLMEAARRSDELGAISATLGSLKGVYVLRPEHAQDASLFTDESQRRILELMDGSRDVERLCRDSGLGRFQTCVIVARLLERHLVTPVRAEDHVRLGEASYNERRLEQTTFHFSRALDLRRTDTRTRSKFAGVLAEAGQTEDAVTQFKLLATLHLERQELEPAAVAYRQAIELAPRDVAVREKLLEVLSKHGSQEEARRCGESLGVLLMTLGLHDKAKQLYQQLLTLDPPDAVPYYRAIAEAQVAAGDVVNAAAGYRQAAREALRAHNDTLAIRLLRAALELDANDSEANELLRQLESGQVELRRVRWRMLKRASVYAVTFTLVCAWAGYDALARRALSDVVTFCYEDVDRGDFDLAINRLRELQEHYPWTLASLSAARQEQSLLELARRSRSRKR